MPHRIALILAVLVSLALAPSAIASKHSAHRHRRVPHLTIARGKAAIASYAKRDHPKGYAITSCHQGTSVAVSCIVSEDGVWVQVKGEGPWREEGITYRATANLLKDNTILIETTRGTT